MRLECDAGNFLDIPNIRFKLKTPLIRSNPEKIKFHNHSGGGSLRSKPKILYYKKRTNWAINDPIEMHAIPSYMRILNTL